MNITWLSANVFGYELLKESVKIKGIHVDAIITLSEGSATRMYDGVARDKWEGFDIPVHQVENINDSVELVKSLKPDIIMMCGWRQIIEKEILYLPGKGMIGFHPTLLPFGRGPAPIINTILEGFKESGVTMLYTDEGVDSGDIIAQEKFSVEEDDYAMDIYNKVVEAGRSLVRKYMPLIVEGRAPRIPQNEKAATYLPKRSLKDNRIYPEKESIEQIHRKIRAFSEPYKGAYLKIGKDRLVIWKAEMKRKK